MGRSSLFRPSLPNLCARIPRSRQGTEHGPGLPIIGGTWSRSQGLRLRRPPHAAGVYFVTTTFGRRRSVVSGAQHRHRWLCLGPANDSVRQHLAPFHAIDHALSTPTIAGPEPKMSYGNSEMPVGGIWATSPSRSFVEALESLPPGSMLCVCESIIAGAVALDRGVKLRDWLWHTR